MYMLQMALPNEMSRDASITKCPLKAAVAINFWTFLKITQAGEIVDKPVRFLKFYKNLKFEKISHILRYIIYRFPVASIF